MSATDGTRTGCCSSSIIYLYTKGCFCTHSPSAVGSYDLKGRKLSKCLTGRQAVGT